MTTANLATLEADLLLVKGQLATAEREVIKPLAARVIEIGEELERLRDEERQGRENRGLCARLVTIRELQKHCPINVRNLIRYAETNGLSASLIRANGKILVDQDKFNEWLESKRES